jgi:hypothetical protein
MRRSDSMRNSTKVFVTSSIASVFAVCLLFLLGNLYFGKNLDDVNWNNLISWFWFFVWLVCFGSLYQTLLKQSAEQAIIDLKHTLHDLKSSGTTIAGDANDDAVKCPFCAEFIKREAVKCKHCGSDLPQLQQTEPDKIQAPTLEQNNRLLKIGKRLAAILVISSLLILLDLLFACHPP